MCGRCLLIRSSRLFEARAVKKLWPIFGHLISGHERTYRQFIQFYIL